MTYKEFNEKYKDFLEKDHYGLAFGNEKFIEWLDSKFQEFIKKPGFKYSQIKSKFGYGRFYCQGLENSEVAEVEGEITLLCMYDDFIKKRTQQTEKECYCGHTTTCDCGNPSYEEFKHNKRKI